MSGSDESEVADSRAPQSGAGSRRQRGSGPRHPRHMTLMGWVSIAVVAALVIVTLGAYVKYREVWDSIRRVDVTDLGHRPPTYVSAKYTNALNLLVFASGSTAGLTRQQELYWHVGADNGDAVSETIMIVHISPGRHLVTVVNIPRDTVVPVYGCAKGPGWAGQQADPGGIEQIDGTLSYGGPPCLWKTIEQQTGIRIDHFIELGYPGLVNVVNDIGGVNVCVPVAVDDSHSGLKLSKGEHHINGVTFLEFWRTREETGDGSDLQRIQRDDYLLAQTLKQVMNAHLLSSPTRLLKVLGDAAGAMTTDTGLTQSDLMQIAQSLRGLSARDYQFIQASNVLYPPNLNWVEFQQPQADALFSAVAHDTTLPAAAGPKRGKSAGGQARAPTSRPSTTPSPSPSPTRSPKAAVGNLAQSYGGITGSASCRSDAGAFAGPLSPG